MENLKSPASGFTAHFDGENTEVSYGFTKLEYASLLIAQGMVGILDQHHQPYYDPSTLSRESVIIAKGVLEEANK
jgi:hypothetical protein